MSPSLRFSIRKILLLSAASVMASTAAISVAQEASVENIETVVVTGSFIVGAAEQAALPVQVLSAEELEKRGTPSLLETIKSISAMNGIIGETNQFGQGQALEGVTQLNLRGLGSARTLVLLNGKRLPNPVADANTLPAAALARIEVLKDGAAATYGSDAMAGVVNFITRESFDGLDLAGDYRYIPDSDGDFNTSLTWGTTGERTDFMVTGNYFHRSELKVSARDWALRTYAENPEGGWTGTSNPTQWRLVNAAGSPITVDPGCEFFGGARNPVTNACVTQFTAWDNLIEEQDSYQIFAQANIDLSSSMRMHVEGLYAYTDVTAATTPSFAPSRTPIPLVTLPAGTTAAEAGAFLVPSTNPGFAEMVARGAIPDGTTAVYIPIGQYRPFLAGGNPLYGYDHGAQRRERELSRFSVELSGDVSDIDWRTAVTYGEYVTERNESDMLTGRLQLAMRGLGGPNCNAATGAPGVGDCLYLNPFSSSIPRNPFTGEANPNFTPGLVNTPALVGWLTERQRSEITQELLTVDAVLSGKLGFLELPGGQIGWALGSQYRDETFKSDYSDFANAQVNRCVDTPFNGNMSCTVPTSPTSFLPIYNPLDVDRDMYAVFGELQLPVTDSFNAQVAARFEDYGDLGGSTFNPKLALRYQLLDSLAFRGSVGTTFRAPPVTSLIPDPVVTLQTIFGVSRPQDVIGNPDLKPEEGTTFSLGVIFNLGGLRATVDYWSFDIDKLLTNEPRQSVLDKVFPNGIAGPDNCGVDPAFIAAHFEFGTAGCGANNITKLKLLQINGAGIHTDGVDINVDYLFENVFGGGLTLGATGTWVNKYEVDALRLNGVSYSAKFDAVGFLNDGLPAPALPEWRAETYVDFSRGNQNLRWTAGFIDQYTDKRAIFATNPNGRLIDSIIVHDLTYRVQLPAQTTLVATVYNVFDEDPSFARKELNYDPQTANPVGRSFKLGMRKQF